MVMDRVDPSSGWTSSAGFMGQMPKRSIVQPRGAESLTHGDIPLGASLGVARGLSEQYTDVSIGQQWISSAIRWGTREGAAYALNTAIGVQPSTQPTPSRFAKWKQRFSRNANGASTAAIKTYSDWLRLGNQSIGFKDLNWNNYRSTVQQNLKNFRNPFQLDSAKKLAQADTWKTYGRQTLWNANVKPIQALFEKRTGKDWGTGLSRIFGVGFMGFDVVKNTKRTYDETKDPTETAIAAGKYTARAVATWELAGIGMAIGKALLPVAAFGTLPIGGILVGALFATFGQNLLDPILKTGNHDPHQDKKKTQPQTNT
ncbi:MAG TPA: hypothetical protein V6C99_02670 [Oculatellaceae cyanobacterium]